jgi:Amidohydrolase family
MDRTAILSDGVVECQFPLTFCGFRPFFFFYGGDFVDAALVAATEVGRGQENLHQDEMKGNVKNLFDAGVLLAAGTDAPYPGVFQGEAMHHELELLVAAGMTPLEAIRFVTVNAARLMHAEGEWGSLAAGHTANVLIVAGNPAERISDTRKVETVILNGKILDRASLRFDPKRDPWFRTVNGNFSSPMQ